LLDQRNNDNNHLRISTGSKRLDELLGGGIERGAVTEIVGSSKTGKTELCFTLSITAQQQKQEKAILDGEHKTTTPSTYVLFIDTEQTFDSRRVSSIAQARCLDPTVIMESITVERIQDFQALEEFIMVDKLDEFLKKNPDTVLLIVDAITALQPIQDNKEGKEYLSFWQESLDSLMYSLQRVALQYNIAVIVTNNIDGTIVSDYPFGQALIPTDRKVIIHASTCRIRFRSYDTYKVARIVHNPCQPEGQSPFNIGGEGITDIKP
jgi:DNA repair protein RadA